MVILNNRFPNITIKDSLTKFMLEQEVITPEDYAMALMFDKKVCLNRIGLGYKYSATTGVLM